MKFNFIQLITCALLSLFLVACASKPTSQLRHPDWERSGKIAIQDEQQNISLLYHWQQQDDNYVIHLMNPMGKIELLLKGWHEQANAQTADGQTYQADTPEELLQELSGWLFPITHAQYWIEGQAGPDSDSLEVNNELNLVRFKSQDWLVELGNYKDQKPRRIKISHQSTPLRLQMIIKNYVRFTH